MRSKQSEGGWLVLTHTECYVLQTATSFLRRQIEMECTSLLRRLALSAEPTKWSKHVLAGVQTYMFQVSRSNEASYYIYNVFFFRRTFLDAALTSRNLDARQQGLALLYIQTAALSLSGTAAALGCVDIISQSSSQDIYARLRIVCKSLEFNVQIQHPLPPPTSPKNQTVQSCICSRSIIRPINTTFSVKKTYFFEEFLK